MGFAKFMSSGLGRGLRIVVGLALMVIGLFSIGGTGGIILAVADIARTSLNFRAAVRRTTWVTR